MPPTPPDGVPTLRINDFDGVADIYDQLVYWAPYEKWVAQLEARLRRHGLQPGARLLDTACGTGSSTFPWIDRGYDVVGSDASAAMLEVARRRAAQGGYHVVWLHEDLERPEVGGAGSEPCAGEFDAVVCMHGGLDYVGLGEPLARALAGLRRRLRAGGLLAFDKCLDVPEFYCEDFSDTIELHCGVAELTCTWDAQAATVTQSCVVYRTDGSGPVVTEFEHRLQAIAPDELLRVVEAAGYEALEPPAVFTVEDPGMGIWRAC
jgi:ubiquinone/menaquinone biosynthesis C-methylase UbiE